MRVAGQLLVLVACTLAGACRRPGDDSKKGASTQTTSAAPARIVAVGSAVTEIVYGLGAGDQVVGVDTSSLFPEPTAKLPKVGYQRTLAAEGILSLKPTLLLASAEAGPPAVLEQMKSAGVHVEVFGTDPSLEGVRSRIEKVAQVLGRDPKPVIAKLDADLETAKTRVATMKDHPRVVALYARGGNTTYVFGEKTTTDVMITLAGGVNAVNGFEGSKPVTAEALVKAAPDVILLPTRGLDSLGGIDGVTKIPGFPDTPAGKNKRVVTLDDLLLLGFGPRTGLAVSELSDKLHPQAAP